MLIQKLKFHTSKSIEITTSYSGNNMRGYPLASQFVGNNPNDYQNLRATLYFGRVSFGYNPNTPFVYGASCNLYFSRSIVPKVWASWSSHLTHAPCFSKSIFFLLIYNFLLTISLSQSILCTCSSFLPLHRENNICPSGRHLSYAVSCARPSPPLVSHHLAVPH